MERTEL